MARTSIFLMALLLCCVAALAAAEYMKYKDPKQPLGVRINDLLKRMTLEEKIGQMTQIKRSIASADVMEKYMIGSVLSGGGSALAPQASAKTWISMVNDFQNGSLSTRLGIPMIYEMDAVHGHNNVCRDPRWGRCYESYSEDPKLVQAMTQIIDGLQGEVHPDSPKSVPFVAGKKNVAACAKHYVGDDGTTKGINENNTVIDFHGLLIIHMPGHYNAIIKGVSTIMISFSSMNGVKMHANHDLIIGFLKNTLRFKIMVPYNYTEFIDGLTYLVSNNFIPMSRIDDAVKRILRVKFMLGVFENPLADVSLVDQLGSQVITS
ncbi:hypothetical protein SLEP1_g49272 [Rubroshorea leprosula]|uniref:Glycoside hydrolase family 3 N-terminal domain-containing protein n=1 Tax=Rubroshorea leprosula TaxID=152421 RepID=A0AAV5LW97_9ROSI|nr:hypothetical protein SLEP1_g49272 [Rubroshorea leprosula]